MKRKFFIIILVLIAGSLPQPLISVVAANGDVPAPEFQSISPTGNPAGSLIFDVNETVKIQYLTDRFQVDGILLLGKGSNLTEDINDARALELTKVSSYQGNSTYEISFNVTSYTYFYAYAWSVTIDNGTSEEIDFFDSALGHQLWVKAGPSYPEFVGITGAVDKNSNFYAPMNSEVTIEYQLLDPLNNANITLAMGLNDTEVLNKTLASLAPMIKLEFNNDTKISIFGLNYTVNERIMLFTAFSENGWEREKLVPNKEFIHVLTNGFSIKKNFDLPVDQYTNIDPIVLNVTAYNQIADDMYFVRYRVFANESADLPLVNWTDIALPTNISYSLNNDTNNYNTSEHVYQAVIPKHNVSQVVELQVYMKYKQARFNESTPIRITIRDSRPAINFELTNNSYIGAVNSTLPFSISNIRGDVLNATLFSNFTSIQDIKGKINATITFTDENNTVYNGIHVVNVTVFNTLNVSRTSLFMYKVDLIPPKASFIEDNGTKTDSNGFITLNFSFNDNLSTDSGLKYAILDWGDGVEVNVLNLTKASHNYRQNVTGGYTAVLTVYDFVGNKVAISLQIDVIVVQSVTITRDSPISLLPIAFTFGVLILLVKYKNK